MVAALAWSCKSKSESVDASSADPVLNPTAIPAASTRAPVPPLPDPIDQSKLAEFLPDALDGFKADPVGGRDEKTQDGIRFVLVERVYHSKDNARHYTMNIVDGRTYRAFYSVGNDDIHDGYKGSRDEEVERKEERIRLVIGDRFIVTIRSKNTEKGFVDKVWASVKHEGLRALAK